MTFRGVLGMRIRRGWLFWTLRTKVLRVTFFEGPQNDGGGASPLPHRHSEAVYRRRIQVETIYPNRLLKLVSESLQRDAETSSA